MFPDLKFAFRQLTRSPGFTAVAIFTLALGIGGTTAMFSFANTLLLRPLPYPEPELMARVFRTTPESQYGSLAPAEYLALRRAEAGYGLLAGYRTSTRALPDTDRPLDWVDASASVFAVLGIQPELGRFYADAEELPGRDRVAVISHDLWQDRFGGDPNVIGRAVRGGKENYEIIGVLPAAATDHRLFGQVGLFSPLGFTKEAQQDRSTRSIQVLGRRHATLSDAQADAVIGMLGNQLTEDLPAPDTVSALRLEGLQVSATGPTGRAIVAMLLGLATCVLLIACSNLANFQLARTIERTRDFAVRAALGASRRQLLWPLFLESLVLSAAGAAAALLVTLWTTDWLRNALVHGIGGGINFPLDWRVVAFAIGAAALTLLAVGLAPALFILRMNTNERLKSAARAATPGRSLQFFRHALIASQIAFALTLAAGAGFFARGITNLFRTDHGWEATRVVQAELLPPPAGYRTEMQAAEFQRALTERLRRVPGATSASFSSALPFLGFREMDHFVGEDTAAPANGGSVETMINGVSPEYFTVTQSRLIAGRAFRDTDNLSAPKVAIVSESLARALYPAGNPIGRRVAVAGTGEPAWLEIVGVAADVTCADVARRNIPAQLYQPAAQNIRGEGFLAVRFQAPPTSAEIEAFRAAISAFDAPASVRNVLTAPQAMTRVTSQMDICRQLLTAFAALGLVLAVVGLYGTVARLVIQRTNEIGIRMALGAQVADVMRLVLHSGARIALVGIGLGWAGATALAIILGRVLPTMQTDGTSVIAGAGPALLFIALAASWLPARRASKVDPLVALRAE
jgi:predicted permease